MKQFKQLLVIYNNKRSFYNREKRKILVINLLMYGDKTGYCQIVSVKYPENALMNYFQIKNSCFL